MTDEMRAAKWTTIDGVKTRLFEGDWACYVKHDVSPVCAEKPFFVYYRANPDDWYEYSVHATEAEAMAHADE
jgi:hypothetical protein